jgi:hypothetical protein
VKRNIYESNTLENKIYLRETQHNTRPTTNTGFNKGSPFNEDNSPMLRCCKIVTEKQQDNES